MAPVAFPYVPAPNGARTKLEHEESKKQYK
jgi:hypothetical protein